MIVENTVNLALTTKKLKTKIDYLTRDKQQAQEYLNDLEYSLKLNKSVIALLSINSSNPPVDEIIDTLQKENSVLRKRLQLETAMKMSTEKECIKKQISRKQQHIFYKARIAELEKRIEEVRLRMHDKEVSFGKIVERLNQYQELKQETLKDKLNNLDFSYDDKFIRGVIAKLNNDKLRLQKESEVSRRKMEECKLECEKVARALRNRVNFYRLKQYAGKSNKWFRQDALAVPDPEEEAKRKRQQDRAIEKEYANPSKINREMVKLIKKEKIANQILEKQFKESVEANEELINWNRILAESKKTMKERLAIQRAKIMVLEDKLRDYQKHFHHLRKTKSTKALVYQYMNLIDEEPNRHYIESLRQEVEKLDIDEVVGLLGHPLPKRRDSLRKSYSMHSIYAEQKGHEFIPGIEY